MRLLARVLTHPAGRSTAEDLVQRPALGEVRRDDVQLGDMRQGVGATLAVADVKQDLEALVTVGLVAVVGPIPAGAPQYRVSSRGIARFGAAALAAPRHAGEATLDLHDHDALLDRLTETLSAGFAANASTGTVDGWFGSATRS